MSGGAVVFVEIPSGSRNKYEWDEVLGGLVLDRRLFTAMTYPADYGFVEGTLAEDGDPLDALVLVSDPTFPGCRIRVRAIGVFHMTDEKGPDEKLLCVPVGAAEFERVADIHDVQNELRDEIEHFFQRYKDLEPSKKTETRGWGNRDEAEKILAAARERAKTASDCLRAHRRNDRADDPEQGDEDPEDEHDPVPLAEAADAEHDQQDQIQDQTAANSPPHAATIERGPQRDITPKG